MRSLDAARSGARAAGMGALTLSMLAGVRMHQRWVGEPERAVVLQRWMHVWAEALLQLFGIEADWHGAELGRPEGARLVVSNHRSPLDILLLLHRFGGVVLSRSDLAEWPLIGSAAQQAETIFVDRKNAMSGVLAIRAVRDRLEKRRTVIVFPEGTTPVGDDVLPFQEGAFAAAHGLPVEIVPVGIAYPTGSEFTEDTFLAHMNRMARRKTTHVSCVIGRPRAMPRTRKGVAETLHGEVQGLVHEARQLLDAKLGMGDTD